MRRTLIVAVVALALVAPAAAVPLEANDGREWITKAQFGKRWPFKVRAGALACRGSGGYGAVTFTTRGATYWVNGVAKGTGDYKSLFRIWRFDPAYPGLGIRVDISPIIDRGLRLC